MFVAGRLLPHLHTICIDQGLFGSSWTQHDELDEDDDYDGLVIGTYDAARLAACCSGLCALGTLIITDDVTAADLLPLLQLSVLTKLELGGKAVADDVAEQVLANLTGLKHLDIKYCPSLTVKGCVHLTSLTALTSLKLQHCSAFADPSGTADLSAQGGAVSNICLWGKASQPDVWLKLQQMCLRDPEGLAGMHQRALQRIAAQEQQLQEQAQQLQQARQQIEELSRQPA